MLKAIADTHAVIWYIYDDPRLSRIARATIEAAAEIGDTIGVSAISFVEIVYLSERGRIAGDVFDRLVAALARSDAVLQDLPLTREIAATLAQISRDEIPDMPDRIIAATAQAASIPVISRDGRIRFSAVPTIW